MSLHIKLANPNALHIHCAAHCANLAAAATAESHALIRDALSNVNELSVLYHRSGKYKQIFDMASTIYDTHQTLKPLCPTRWLCRVRSITAVIN